MHPLAARTGTGEGTMIKQARAKSSSYLIGESTRNCYRELGLLMI